jgi:hypothetical protein
MITLDDLKIVGTFTYETKDISVNFIFKRMSLLEYRNLSKDSLEILEKNIGGLTLWSTFGSGSKELYLRFIGKKFDSIETKKNMLRLTQLQNTRKVIIEKICSKQGYNRKKLPEWSIS